MSRKSTRRDYSPPSLGRRFARWAATAAVLLGLAYGVYDLYKFCVRSDLFLVEEVRIVGVQLLTQSEVFREMELPEKARLWQIAPERIEAQLGRLHLVEAVQVRRVLPQTLVVEILERKPRALWTDPGSGERYVLDEKRWLLCTLGEFQERVARSGVDRRVIGPLPTVVCDQQIRGWAPGDRLDVEGLEEVLKSFDLLLTRGDAWIASIDRFERLEPVRGWVVRCKTLADEVRLGNDAIAVRLGRVQPVWSFLEEKNIPVAYIDLRFEGQGVVIKPHSLGVYDWLELNGLGDRTETELGQLGQGVEWKWGPGAPNDFRSV